MERGEGERETFINGTAQEEERGFTLFDQKGGEVAVAPRADKMQCIFNTSSGKELFLPSPYARWTFGVGVCEEVGCAAGWPYSARLFLCNLPDVICPTMLHTLLYDTLPDDFKQGRSYAEKGLLLSSY